jgi:hypothetical protein
MVNGFDLQAVGWSVTRDVCWEFVRTLFGSERRLPRETLGELGRRWERVQCSARKDWSKMNGWMRLIAPRRTPLSSRTEEALGDFIEQLTVSCPDRYGFRALHRRWLDVMGRIIGVALCAFLLDALAPETSSTVAQTELALVLIGGWSVAVAIQLWRMYVLTRRFAEHPSTRRSTSRSLHRR